MMTKKIQKILLSRPKFLALCYADVFDFPLTGKELKDYAINDTKISRYKAETDGTFVFLSGKHHLPIIRRQRAVESMRKMKIARRIAKILYKIPSIEMIAVTGALSMNNVKESDDIDFLIVTKPGTLWITRLLIVLLTELIGVRRRPYDSNVGDRICLNMFIDTDHLCIPEKEQDVFSAHEIAQIIILEDRNKTSSNYWVANTWILHFLPNLQIPRTHIKKLDYVQNNIVQYIERLAGNIQMRYMNKRITREVIQNGYMRFHPNDARTWILREYKKRINKYQ